MGKKNRQRRVEVYSSDDEGQPVSCMNNANAPAPAPTVEEANNQKDIEEELPAMPRLKTAAEKKAEKKARAKAAKNSGGNKPSATSAVNNAPSNNSNSNNNNDNNKKGTKNRKQRKQYSSTEEETSESESDHEAPEPEPVVVKAKTPQQKKNNNNNNKKGEEPKVVAEKVEPTVPVKRIVYGHRKKKNTNKAQEEQKRLEEEELAAKKKKELQEEQARLEKEAAEKLEKLNLQGNSDDEQHPAASFIDNVSQDWDASDVEDDWENIGSTSDEKEEEKEKQVVVVEEIEPKPEPEPIPKPEAKVEPPKKEELPPKEKVFRSPICCVLGHVDTGKTKILDNIRSSNVQDGEAGGITQQIGATFVPKEAIVKRIAPINKQGKIVLDVPGLLIIDTPGHESFSNLRLRGSSLCDIAILVIDLQHGLEPQTIESLKMIRKKKTPFVVALNKIDVCYGWEANKNAGFRQTFKKQKKSVQDHFNDLASRTILQLNEQGLNADLYYENKDLRSNISLVPTSARTGEGIPDLLGLLTQLTQRFMAKRITLKENVECTVLEVKKVTGLGTTIDVILSQGTLKQGQTIVLCGLNGAIVTTVRELLMPEPLKELRIKSQYKSHKEITAAQGVKIFAKGLGEAVAGTQLYVCDAGDQESIDFAKRECEEELVETLKKFDTEEQGVTAQASTLGALEAILVFFKASDIPVASVDIGPVHKKNVVKTSTQKDEQYRIILSFDVSVDPDAALWAKQNKITIFTADIIYHLFDKYIAFRKDIAEKRKNAVRHLAWFPCRMSILPDAIFRKRDPIIMGVNILEGTLRKGIPIIVPGKNGEEIGVIDSIELNEKQIEVGKSGTNVCVRIQNTADAPRAFGRHFDDKDELCTKLSRKAIDTLKDHFRDDMSKDDWKLIMKMKKKFGII